LVKKGQPTWHGSTEADRVLCSACRRFFKRYGLPRPPNVFEEDARDTGAQPAALFSTGDSGDADSDTELGPPNTAPLQHPARRRASTNSSMASGEESVSKLPKIAAAKRGAATTTTAASSVSGPMVVAPPKLHAATAGTNVEPRPLSTRKRNLSLAALEALVAGEFAMAEPVEHPGLVSLLSDAPLKPPAKKPRLSATAAEAAGIVGHVSTELDSPLQVEDSVAEVINLFKKFSSPLIWGRVSSLSRPGRRRC
jgi:hypothetical protein